jgi:hypothetical protein
LIDHQESGASIVRPQIKSAVGFSFAFYPARPDIDREMVAGLAVSCLGRHRRDSLKAGEQIRATLLLRTLC